MNFILSLLPIALILFLMVSLKWSAARAGSAGYLTALVIALLFFGSGLQLLAYAHVKALLLSLDVLLIIWAAFLLYRVVDEAGAIHTIGLSLPHLTSDRGMQALVIGWVFASFLQGVGGFGVPVAVVAPLLVGLGFSPLNAVVIPSVGHAWAVTFGSMGSSFQSLVAATGLPDYLLSPPAALFLGIACIFMGWMVAHAAGGWRSLRKLFFVVIILGTVMSTIQFIIARTSLWSIAAFSGGLAGLLVTIPLARRHRGDNQNNGKLDIKRLTVALSGYGILILLTLAIQTVPVIKDALSHLVVEVKFPAVQTSLGFITPAGSGRKIYLLRHAGTILLYVSGLAYWVYRRSGLYGPGATTNILKGTMSRVMSSSVSIVSMVAMAVVMEHAGMTHALAQGLAESMGKAFPLVAPWIGALGAFMTGSNTNSNVVFGALQLHTAELLGYLPVIILAGQTAGAAIASVVAPTKVVVGASTAGMAGREGEVMRALIVYILLLVLLISILTGLGVLLWQP